MALTACKECGKDISTEAAACPHCGAPQKKRAVSVLRWIWYAACAVVLLVVFRTCYQIGDVLNRAPIGAESSGSAQKAACSASDISVKSLRARFENACSGRPCMSMKGVAVLTNSCAEAIGVQVKITGLDASGAPVASRDLWPASINNIPPGDYTISLDHYLEYDSRMKSFTIQPIAVKRWTAR